MAVPRNNHWLHAPFLSRILPASSAAIAAEYLKVAAGLAANHVQEPKPAAAGLAHVLSIARFWDWAGGQERLSAAVRRVIVSSRA
jgi:hypothetical protein